MSLERGAFGSRAFSADAIILCSADLSDVRFARREGFHFGFLLVSLSFASNSRRNSAADRLIAT